MELKANHKNHPLASSIKFDKQNVMVNNVEGLFEVDKQRMGRSLIS